MCTRGGVSAKLRWLPIRPDGRTGSAQTGGPVARMTVIQWMVNAIHHAASSPQAGAYVNECASQHVVITTTWCENLQRRAQSACRSALRAARSTSDAQDIVQLA